MNWTNITVPLGKLQPWDLNPRQSTKAQAKRILKSFEKFGQVQPVSVGPNLEVYDGHQRLSALLTIHGPEYQIDARQSERPLTDAERRELVISLHAGATGEWNWDSLSGWDASTLMDSGFDADLLKEWKRDTSALDAFLKSEKPEIKDTEPQIDRAEELLQKWQVKTGDLWQLGDHRLICGDCTDPAVVEKVMGGGMARLVCTDPPYGVNYGGKLEAANPMGYRVRHIENDALSPEQLEALIRTAYFNCSAHAAPGAAIYAACPAGTPLPAAISAFKDSGFDFRWQLVWLKDQIVLSRADYHFKHENILYGWKSDGAHYFIDDRKQSSVFEYPRPKSSDEHPTMKPVELMEHLIRNSSEHGDAVLEPFDGSGSTLLACENLGRKCRAIEISPAYVAVALERWSQATGKTPVRLE